MSDLPCSVKVFGLAISLFSIGISGSLPVAAAEGDPAFQNLRKGPDGQYHWEEAKDSKAVALGRIAFRKYCASCHGLDAKGDGPVAKILKEKPADLTQIALKNGGDFPVRETYQMVDGRTAVGAHGSREMPVWGDEFQEEMCPHLFRHQLFDRP